VVSVGNLAVGGRGKTPLVALLARWLLEAGERPAILTRGYRRRDRSDGVVVVSDGRHLLADLARSGDEPLMLALETPGACVLVGESRALSGALAERLLGATVHLLDDGFQHAALARDLDLVVVTDADLHDRPLPWGRLRESVGALACADAVVFDRGFAAPRSPQAPSTDPAGQRVTLRRSFGELTPIEPGAGRLDRGAPVVTLAGIAQPGRFADALAGQGWHVTRRLVFPDHHRFGTADLAQLAAAVRQSGATAVVTTAKDAVRLRPLRPLPVPVWVAPLEIALEPAAPFREWLLGRVREARG
jgi:tetraacyldisaccharide 4'-kinase